MSNTRCVKLRTEVSIYYQPSMHTQQQVCGEVILYRRRTGGMIDSTGGRGMWKVSEALMARGPYRHGFADIGPSDMNHNAFQYLPRLLRSQWTAHHHASQPTWHA